MLPSKAPSVSIFDATTTAPSRACATGMKSKAAMVASEQTRRNGKRVKVPRNTSNPQCHLGNMVGTGREAINNQLALWRSAGIVDTGRRAVAIRNCEATWALVGCV